MFRKDSSEVVVRKDKYGSDVRTDVTPLGTIYFA